MPRATTHAGTSKPHETLSSQATGISMKKKSPLLISLALALTLPVATLMIVKQAVAAQNTLPPRPEGPGDIYAAAGCPLVAAHSTTRALYASYNGPLYQVMRQSDGKTLDIGVVQPSAYGCRRICRRGGAGRLLRQHLLLDHHDLRPVRPWQPPRPGAPRRVQRPGHGWVQ